MLKKGVIQTRNNPYAYPLILVKKKDGGWRMCVDYRYLNALMTNSKYPQRVVRELLDEQSGSHFFTKLDLCGGYHHIRLLEVQELKTSYKNHHGHWEVKVIPFRLTNALVTFQSIINAMLAHLLRKGALISWMTYCYIPPHCINIKNRFYKCFKCYENISFMSSNTSEILLRHN